MNATCVYEEPLLITVTHATDRWADPLNDCCSVDALHENLLDIAYQIET